MSVPEWNPQFRERQERIMARVGYTVGSLFFLALVFRYEIAWLLGWR